MPMASEPRLLSRSGVFHRLGSLLSDVSSVNSSELHNPLANDPPALTDKDIIDFDTSFAHLTYRLNLSTIEHIHFRCRPVSSYDSSLHTSLCEAVLGIFPDTCPATTSSPFQPPVLVRGVVERRHRRIKVGDWLQSINDTDVNWINLNDIISKYHSARKLRITVRHPYTYHSTFASSLQPPIILPSIEEKKLFKPDQIDCIHSILYYEKRPDQGFKLLYQHPRQKDIFFAAGGVFPTLTQLMRDMNEHDSLLRRFVEKLPNDPIHQSV